MGVSPLRLVAALVFGGMVTGGLYLTQQANGRPLPAAAAPAKPAAKPAPAKPKVPQAAIPLTTAPKRIVFRHSAPGDVVLTVHGAELQVQFVPAPPQGARPPAKPTQQSARPPHKTTPVATP